MAFDISRLTSAVNKYLNSISDIGTKASQAAQEIADKAQFQSDLSEAIKSNIASKTRDVDTIPDIAATVQSEVESALSGIDSTFEQINGAFLEISEAGKSTSSAKDSVAASAGAGESKNASSEGTSKSENADAYKGTLSADALKELSGSGYFSGNLIASSLFKTDDENGTSSGSTSALNSASSALASSLGQNITGTNPFSTLSLDQLNVNSLLANSLGVNSATTDSLTSALKSIAESGNTSASGQAADTAKIQDSTGNDLAKALIKAYTTTAKSAVNTSIFGDFSL